MGGTNDFLNILRHLNQAIMVQLILIVLAAWLLIMLVQRLLPGLAGKLPGPYRTYLLASVPVLRLGIMLLAVVFIIPRIIEPTIENLVALLATAGLVVGFAFKDYVSSLIAGIATLYEMPYRPGDWIAIDGAYGEVRTIGLRAVEIVTPDDTVVVIPHLKLWDGLIFNANDGSRNLLCVADFSLHPQHDAALVQQTLYDVGLTSSLVQLQRPITVMVQEKPWGTHYRLKAYPVEPREQFRFITDLTIRGKAALLALGVEFAVAPAALGPTS